MLLSVFRSRLSCDSTFYYRYRRYKILFQDVKQLESELPNVAVSYLVSDSKFNHMDFLFAIDVQELVYNRVLTLLEKYQ